jgi:type I restriction-modification system DNA methylase subunit
MDWGKLKVELSNFPNSTYNHSVIPRTLTREVVDITELNAELKVTVAKIDQLRKDIDAIVAEIEGDKP